MARIAEQEYFVENKPNTRFDRMEKIDRTQYYSKMHTNLVKWWNVSFDEGTEEEEYDADAAAEELLADALGSDYYDNSGGIEEAAGSDELTAEALEIFNRLQAEAAADEAAKQAEIDAAKAIWE